MTRQIIFLTLIFTVIGSGVQVCPAGSADVIYFGAVVYCPDDSPYSVALGVDMLLLQNTFHTEKTAGLV